ncbi:hypothetical protein HMPREF3190_00234 [Umbribacter vaginalis]|jgi:hypothetical protein|nr:hypothetical protein HMPREF3190_00234 [Coriobacteriales bacterium DNF00809]
MGTTRSVLWGVGSAVAAAALVAVLRRAGDVGAAGTVPVVGALPVVGAAVQREALSKRE